MLEIEKGGKKKKSREINCKYFDLSAGLVECWGGGGDGTRGQVTDLLQGKLETVESAPIWRSSGTSSSNDDFPIGISSEQNQITLKPAEIHVLAHS